MCFTERYFLVFFPLASFLLFEFHSLSLWGTFKKYKPQVFFLELKQQKYSNLLHSLLFHSGTPLDILKLNLGCLKLYFSLNFMFKRMLSYSQFGLLHLRVLIVPQTFWSWPRPKHDVTCLGNLYQWKQSRGKTFGAQID